ncbi:MAG: hypothetical protein Q7R22_012165 [Verrucomicrobiota bacterium JB025]|nr:hypothetical protein [Verrucomicrobiota bacterium JB025]
MSLTYSPLNRHLLLSAALTVASAAHAATLTTSGNINTPSNWDTGTLPLVGETGTVDIDASWPSTSAAGTLAITGDLVFGGGSTLTAAIDVVGSKPNSVTFNDVTVTVNDDIFTGAATGNFIFNAGSVTNVNDDFEANGGGTITMNGGTHTVGIAPAGTANFGAQTNSTLNFLGGTVSADHFRVVDTGTINVGGAATLTANSIDLAGALDFATDWTGSLTIPGIDWETTLVGAGATLDGGTIDSTVFANNFVVTGDTLTLNATAPIDPLKLQIAQSDGNLDFAWNSMSGMQYDLVSSTDLTTNPTTWLPYNDGVTTYENILSTGTGTQTLTGVLKDGTRRFFALIEEPASQLVETP